MGQKGKKIQENVQKNKKSGKKKVTFMLVLKEKLSFKVETEQIYETNLFG